MDSPLTDPLWKKSSFSGDTSCVEVAWMKSSFSGSAQAGECVEAAERDGNWLLRDSKNPDGPVLTFTPAERDAFIKGVKAGEFG
jgi:Domain of unknown function (DUF397)